MQRYQDGGNSQQEQVLQQIAQYIQQAVQQGQTPEQIAADLIGQQIPPQIIGQMFVQMGMPEEQAAAALQTAMQGNSPQGMAAGQQQQGPAEEAMEQGPAQQNPEEESMETPMQMYGGMYKVGGQQGNPGVYSDGYSGTYSGGQYFANGGAYGGVSPYMYNDAYSYMAMGGMIPVAQNGYDMGGPDIPPRPQPQDYPDYASFKADDESWLMTYGDQAMDYTDQQWTPTTAPPDLGYSNPALSMVGNLANATTASTVSGNVPSPSTTNTASSTTSATTPATTVAAPTPAVDLISLLSGLGQPSSFAARKELATQFGMPNYTGTAEQDATLAQQLQQVIAASKNVSANSLIGSTSLSPLPFQGVISSMPTVKVPTVQTAPTVTTTTSTVKLPSGRTRKVKKVVTSTVPPISSYIPDNTFYPGVSAPPSQTYGSYNPFSTASALNYISQLNQNVAANPSAYNIASTDTIPTVSLNAPDSLKGAPTDGSEQAMVDSILEDNAKRYYNETIKPDTIKYDDPKTYEIQLTDEEKRKQDEEALNKAWESVNPALIAGDIYASYLFYKGFKKMKNRGDIAKLMEANANDGKMINDVLNRYDDPIARLEMAEKRGYATLADKKIFDEQLQDKKLKTRANKLTINKDIDPAVQKSQDLMREIYQNKPNGQFFESDMESLALHLDDNYKQANEILNKIKARGFKTPSDVKKLNQLTGNIDFVKELSKNIKEKTGLRGKLGDLNSKFNDLSTQVGKYKTKIGSKFQTKYNFVPELEMAGTNAWRTFTNKVGNVADLSVSNVDLEEAQYVLDNKDKFPKKAIAQAESTIQSSNANPQLQKIIDAYTKQTGSAPASNTDIIDLYHQNLEAGHKTPLVDLIEDAVGTKSIRQRSGALGDTFRGIKKSIDAGTAEMINAIALREGMVPPNIQIKTPTITTAKAASPTPEVNISNSKKVAKTYKKIQKGNVRKGVPEKISKPIELSPQITNAEDARNLFRQGTVTTSGTATTKSRKKVKTEIEKLNEVKAVTNEEEASRLLKEAKLEGWGSKAANWLRAFGKALGKEEYGGPVDNGPYIPDYGMAYGGDIPEAMYGMGFAEGGQMPQWLAERRFKAAGNEHMMSDYGYAYGGGYYAEGGTSEDCSKIDPNSMWSEDEQRCICKEGYVADQETGLCEKAGTSDVPTPSTKNTSSYNMPTSSSITPGFHTGFGLKDKGYDFSYGFNTDPNFENALHTAALKFNSPFNKRGTLGITGEYAPNRFWNAGLTAGIPLSKRNAMLTLTGGLGRNYMDPSSADESLSGMRLAPKSIYNTRTGDQYNQAAWNAAVGVKGNLGKKGTGPQYNINASYSNVPGRGLATGGININPANKGKFTKSAQAAGMGVQEFASKVLANKDRYDATTVKRANFARNAAKWKHAEGGIVEVPQDQLEQTLQELKNGGYQFQIMR